MCRIVRCFGNLALIGMLCWPRTSLGEEGVAREAIDGALTRSLLEVGAFCACAAFDNDDQMAKDLTRAWRLDVAEAVDVLRRAGYPDDYTGALVRRLDLEKATPKIDDRSALEGYCQTLGDWRTRRALLFSAIPPQVELSHLLKQ